MPEPAEIKRPTGVTVAAILSIIIGAFCIIEGCYFLEMFDGLFWGDPNVVALARGLLVGTGIVLLLQAYGFWHGKGWSETLSVLYGLFGLFGLFGIAVLLVFIGNMPLARFLLACFRFLSLWVIEIAFIFYLIQPQARAFLRKETIEDVIARDKSEWEAPTKALCEHLRKIGLDATVESKETKWSYSLILGRGILGTVRVADRNIDLVEWEKIWYPSDDIPDTYRCNYVVEAKVEGLEEKLKAEGKPVRKSFFSRKVVDFKWKGEELAQSLGSDTELRSFLLSQRRPSKVEIEPWKEHQCVRIRPKRYTDSPEAAFPTVEAFEAYDRIAQHIRSIANVRP